MFCINMPYYNSLHFDTSNNTFTKLCQLRKLAIISWPGRVNDRSVWKLCGCGESSVKA